MLIFQTLQDGCLSISENDCIVTVISTDGKMPQGIWKTSILTASFWCYGILVCIHHFDHCFEPCYMNAYHTKIFDPVTPKSDQLQTSPAALPELLHHTVWRTWLFIAYSDEILLHYQFSLHHSCIYGECTFWPWEWKGSISGPQRATHSPKLCGPSDSILCSWLYSCGCIVSKTWPPSRYLAISIEKHTGEEYKNNEHVCSNVIMDRCERAVHCILKVTYWKSDPVFQITLLHSSYHRRQPHILKSNRQFETNYCFLKTSQTEGWFSGVFQHFTCLEIQLYKPLGIVCRYTTFSWWPQLRWCEHFGPATRTFYEDFKNAWCYICLQSCFQQPEGILEPQYKSFATSIHNTCYVKQRPQAWTSGLGNWLVDCNHMLHIIYWLLFDRQVVWYSYSRLVRCSWGIHNYK